MKRLIRVTVILAIVILFTTAKYEPVKAAGWSPAAKAKAEEIVSLVSYPGMTDYEKAIWAHDYLCSTCTGNIASLEANIYLPSDHSADGPLFYGTAVCEGYADAFRLFMNIMGVKNRRVSGWAGGYHGWNEVYIDGQWWAVDVTFDDPYIIGYDPSGVYSRQYCLISPAVMALDHIAMEYH